MTYKDLDELCERNGFEYELFTKEHSGAGCYVIVFEKISGDDGDGVDDYSEYIYGTKLNYDTAEEAEKEAFDFMLDYLKKE